MCDYASTSGRAGGQFTTSNETVVAAAAEAAHERINEICRKFYTPSKGDLYGQFFAYNFINIHGSPFPNNKNHTS